MNLIEIDLTKAPGCLNDHRQNGGSYSDLSSECLQETREILRDEQKGFCAYCEQKFKSTVFIEHYHPQGLAGINPLDFSNFLGVCSGKAYSDKRTGTFISHCDTSKGGSILNIDPRDRGHIKQIYYKGDGSIRSHIPPHDQDLDSTLNLNNDFLKKRREKVLKYTFDNLVKASRFSGFSKQEAAMKAIKHAEDRKSEFSGYLLFRFKELLKAFM